MIANLPDPYPDELLYSVFARFACRMDFPSNKSVLAELFGTKTVTAVHDLPSHLRFLVSHLPPGSPLTADYLIDSHTLLPFYSAYLPEKRASELRSNMLGDRGSAVHMRAGIMAGSVKMLTYLRYCPICADNDRVVFSETYWHRAHQLPGIELCPVHGVHLRNSLVRVSNRRTRHVFMCAERALPPDFSAERQVKDDEVLVALAKEAELLLNRSIVMPELDLIHKRYMKLLTDQGYATRHGTVRWKVLLDELRRRYKAQTLKSIQCELPEGNGDNWLKRLLHKKDTAQHPIHHLLLTHFLGYSLKSLFSEVGDERPFGTGPWPCLNPASDHYRQAVIEDCDILYLRSGAERPTGKFTCNCGFAYSRTGPDSQAGDRYRIGKMVSYGPAWERRLTEQWDNRETSLRDISRDLNVDPRTVKRVALKLGLEFPRAAIRTTNAVNLATKNGEESGRGKKYKGNATRHRKKWLNGLSKNPTSRVSVLRAKIPKTYTWLYRHDKDWLFAHRPVSVPLPRHKSTVDWEARDSQISEALREAALRIREMPGRPVQISVSALGRQCGHAPVIRRNLNKLPKTQAILDELAECRDSYGVRRLHWAVDHCHANGIRIVRWRLIRLAGIGRVVDHPPVEAALNEILSRESD